MDTKKKEEKERKVGEPLEEARESGTVSNDEPSLFASVLDDYAPSSSGGTLSDMDRVLDEAASERTPRESESSAIPSEGSDTSLTPSDADAAGPQSETTPEGALEEPQEVSEGEAAGVSDFFDAFAQANNWKIDPEAKKPQTIDELVRFMGDLVRESSTPRYADERVKALDDYVRDGGDFLQMYKDLARKDSLPSPDDEPSQRQLLKEYLDLQGYTPEQAKEKIERYAEAGLLADEAKDARVQLESFREANIKEEQERRKEEAEKERQEMKSFYDSVVKGISEFSSFGGSPLTADDRKNLYSYILLRDKDGLTDYQKDIAKDRVASLIQSAYLLMKGGNLFTQARKEGRDDAVKVLRERLKSKPRSAVGRDSIPSSSDKPKQILDLTKGLF